MYFNDYDFEYKIRFQKIMWKMGYWARIEIPVLAYDIDGMTKNLKKHDLTDLDVYGEKINSDFSRIKQIGDCKSGKNVRIVERVFWLKGVMEYTKATKGFLIKKKISNNIRIILDRMQIYGVDDSNLSNLEKIYQTNSLDSLFDMNYYVEKKKIIDSLNDEYEKIYKYLSQRYWFNESYVNLRTLLNMLDKNNFYKKFYQGNREHIFLLMETIILLARLLFECCNYVMHRNIADIETAVIEFIHGGVNGLNNKMNMVREIRPILQSITNSEQVAQGVFIKPIYYNELVRIIASFVSDPSNVIDVMRYLEMLQYEIIIDNKVDIGKFIGANYSDITLKLSKDIIEFYIKISKVDQQVLKDILYR